MNLPDCYSKRVTHCSRPSGESDATRLLCQLLLPACSSSANRGVIAGQVDDVLNKESDFSVTELLQLFNDVP